MAGLDYGGLTMSAHRPRAYRWPAVALAGILLIASESALAQPSPAARRGMMFVRIHCAQCHAINRVGPSPLASATPLRDLRLKYPVSDLQRPLATGIHPGMPVIRLEAHQVEDVMEYLRMFER